MDRAYNTTGFIAAPSYILFVDPPFLLYASCSTPTHLDLCMAMILLWCHMDWITLCFIMKAFCTRVYLDSMRCSHVFYSWVCLFGGYNLLLFYTLNHSCISGIKIRVDTFVSQREWPKVFFFSWTFGWFWYWCYTDFA